MIIDYLGNELNAGDSIVYMTSRGLRFERGTVISLRDLAKSPDCVEVRGTRYDGRPNARTGFTHPSRCINLKYFDITKVKS